MKIRLAFLMTFMSFSCFVMAQDVDDDMYFVPSKKKAKLSTTATSYTPSNGNLSVENGVSTDDDVDYHIGKLRDVDDYNRRGNSQDKGKVIARLVNDTLYVTTTDSTENSTRLYSKDSYRDEDYEDDYYFSSRLARYHRLHFYDPFLWDVCYGWYDPWYDPWYGIYGPYFRYGYCSWYDWGWGWHHHHGWYHPLWSYGWVGPNFYPGYSHHYSHVTHGGAIHGTSGTYARSYGRNGLRPTISRGSNVRSNSILSRSQSARNSMSTGVADNSRGSRLTESRRVVSSRGENSRSMISSSDRMNSTRGQSRGSSSESMSRSISTNSSRNMSSSSPSRSSSSMGSGFGGGSFGGGSRGGSIGGGGGFSGGSRGAGRGR